MATTLTYALTSDANRQLRRLTKRDRLTAQRINDGIVKYTQAPALLLSDAKRITGTNEYRFRVGDWRVRFVFDDATRPTHMTITAIRHPKDTY